MEIQRPARWTFEQALPIIPGIAQIAMRCGYSVALCGSVLLSGEGDDLDLRFIPEEPSYNAQRCIEEIRTLEEIQSASDPEPGRLGRSWSVIWLRTGQWIDAQFLTIGGDSRACSATIL
jgi:hypothetical protein